MAKERKDQVDKASKLLNTIQEHRLTRADLANVEERREEVLQQARKMRAENDARACCFVDSLRGVI